MLVVALLALGGMLVPSAFASFPYSRNASPTGYDDLYLDPGQVPTDLGGNQFKFAATPDPGNAQNSNPVELGGVRGAHVVDADALADTAFQVTTGRPDVTIAILDSGIKWNDAGDMSDLRRKTRISTGEVPKPRNDGLATPNEAGEDCSGAGPYSHDGDWDLNGDGVFNLIDYSCDDRVQTDSPNGVGPAGMFEPQDLLIAFSDGVDDDGNGYVDDIVGWDFVDDDNDPFDDVQYGHGTGEAQDSTAEADNGGDVGACPNCMGIYLRVGDSFVADVNRFGAAVTYATDNGVADRPGGARLAQQLEPRPRRGQLRLPARGHRDGLGRRRVRPAQQLALEPAARDRRQLGPRRRRGRRPNKSYLAFNGCTNFGAKITISIPSTSCSSNAVGLAAGFAGLIYSAALNAEDAGALDPYPDHSSCELVGGDPCPITPNEIKQVLASGSLDGVPQADDIDFAGSPAGSANEPSCSPTPLPGCTSPYGAGDALRSQVNANRPVIDPPVPSTSYPARKGFDQFYGYGRANMDHAVRAVVDDPADPDPTELPPEADITSPRVVRRGRPRRGGGGRRGRGLRARRSATAAGSSSRPASTRTTP